MVDAAQDAPSPVQSLIRDRVTENLASSGPRVQQIIVDKLASEEVDKRVVLLQRAMTEIEKARGELKSIKPDFITYNEDRTPKDASWSKGTLDKRDKAQQRVAKLEKAFTDAAENSNFDELKKLLGGGGNEPKPKPTETEDED
jgi:hypothetical protein